jgi:hypothetical protein
MELDTKSLQKRIAKALNQFVKDKKEMKVKDKWVELKDPAFFADVMKLEGRYAINGILQFLGTKNPPVVLFTIPIKINENNWQIGAHEYKTQQEVEDVCEKAAISFAELNFR